MVRTEKVKITFSKKIVYQKTLKFEQTIIQVTPLCEEGCVIDETSPYLFFDCHVSCKLWSDFCLS